MKELKLSSERFFHNKAEFYDDNIGIPNYKLKFSINSNYA